MYGHIRYAAFLIVVTFAFCVLAPQCPGQEPAWWTKQKKDCGLPSNLAYNSWDGAVAQAKTRAEPLTMAKQDVKDSSGSKKNANARKPNKNAWKQQRKRSGSPTKKCLKESDGGNPQREWRQPNYQNDNGKRPKGQHR
ncbi:MAG: hypothetical protein IPK98_08840 [Chloracidobacterium sp.]|nr:hypothetical protein [Chloracidobacterium sp.]